MMFQRACECKCKIHVPHREGPHVDPPALQSSQGATAHPTAVTCSLTPHAPAQVDVINATLGKALGGATGGYTTGRGDIVALLRQKSRPYLFSNTLAPSVAAASIAVFRMLEGGTDLLGQLQANTARFRGKMADAGFTLGGVDHPIVVRTRSAFLEAV